MKTSMLEEPPFRSQKSELLRFFRRGRQKIFGSIASKTQEKNIQTGSCKEGRILWQSTTPKGSPKPISKGRSAKGILLSRNPARLTFSPQNKTELSLSTLLPTNALIPSGFNKTIQLQPESAASAASTDPWGNPPSPKKAPSLPLTAPLRRKQGTISPLRGEGRDCERRGRRSEGRGQEGRRGRPCSS